MEHEFLTVWDARKIGWIKPERMLNAATYREQMKDPRGDHATGRLIDNGGEPHYARAIEALNGMDNLIPIFDIMLEQPEEGKGVEVDTMRGTVVLPPDTAIIWV